MYGWSQNSTIEKLNNIGAMEIINSLVMLTNMSLKDIDMNYPRILNVMISHSGYKSADNWVYKV
jgi:hypothetical protein